MKKLFIAIFLFSSLILPVSNVSASSAGGGVQGFPPPPKVNLVCKDNILTLNLPNNQTFSINIPKCRVEVVKSSENNFDNRFNDFRSRVMNGG